MHTNTSLHSFAAALRRNTSALLFGLILIACASFVHAQNARVDGVVQSRTGAPAPGAFVAVCLQPATTTVIPCTPTAPICSSAADVVCTQPNPIQADGLGNYSFYITPGTYTLQFYGSGLTTRVQPDQGFGIGTASFSQFLLQSHTYGPNAVQIFPATLTTADFVLGCVITDPSPSLATGSMWCNSASLNSAPHPMFWDGSTPQAVMLNSDSVANFAAGATGTGPAVRQTGATLIQPNIGDATGTSLTLNLTTGDWLDLQQGLTTPFIQAIPAAGHIKTGYGTDHKYQMSVDGDPFMPVLRQGPALTSDFTTANNTNLQLITDGTHPLQFTKTAVAQSANFRCELMYSQATANVAVAFGIQAATANPTNIAASAQIFTSTTASTVGTLATLATTTATAIVSATPSATATVFRAVIAARSKTPLTPTLSTSWSRPLPARMP
jgi:hypothetical protein